MFRVTADTNIYISAFNFGGPPRRLIQLASEGSIELAISDPILSEIIRVLRGKFRWNDDEIESLGEEIRSFTRHIVPTRTLNVISEDEPDNRILECAAEHVSDFIISHDNDFLRRRVFEGIPIVKAGTFLLRGFGIMGTQEGLENCSRRAQKRQA